MAGWQNRNNPEMQYVFPKTHDVSESRSLAENLEQERVSTAGRVLGLRDQGGIIFGDLNDATGTIQFVANAETLPDFESFQQLTIGDWIGVSGACNTTRRGEASIFVDDWVKLAETEIPFPDKRIGIQNPDTLIRQRYLDLASNPETRKRFIQRSLIIAHMRNFLAAQNFIEVETPILQPLYGGASARPFTTHHNALDTDLYLRIAPELYLKRLVVGGMERVFEIGKVFRNEGMSPRHNPEFTMMEAYGAYWDYEDQINLVEGSISDIAKKIHGTEQVPYQGGTIDFSTPWKRATLDQLVSDAIGEDVSINTDIDHLRELCAANGIEVTDGYGPGKMLLELYEKLVEQDLEGPIFVTDYPKEVSPLARDHRSRPGYTERFEVVVRGRELSNGYSELNNAREQYSRFADQEKQVETDDEAMRMDYDYIRALQYGLPPTAGVGIGMDRLVMLMTDSNSIKDVILFPTQRPDNFETHYDTES